MWRDLLERDARHALPWVGGPVVRLIDRTWQIRGRRPPEYGWHTFRTQGRYAEFEGPTDPDVALLDRYERDGRLRRGYVVGDRLVLDGVSVTPDVDRLIEQTEPLYGLDPNVMRFGRVVALDLDVAFLYVTPDFGFGPELEVQMAFEDRVPSIDYVANVTPALDLAFRFATVQRERTERRRRELEEQRAREERARELQRVAGTAVGRRALAAHDIERAAREALRLTDAELLDVRPGLDGEHVVRYRFRGRRLECVVDQRLRIVDAGICLQDHTTGRKDDALLTLEALPGVVGEAIDRDVLVVWRHG